MDTDVKGARDTENVTSVMGTLELARAKASQMSQANIDKRIVQLQTKNRRKKKTSKTTTYRRNSGSKHEDYKEISTQKMTSDYISIEHDIPTHTDTISKKGQITKATKEVNDKGETEIEEYQKKG